MTIMKNSYFSPLGPSKGAALTAEKGWPQRALLRARALLQARAIAAAPRAAAGRRLEPPLHAASSKVKTLAKHVRTDKLNLGTW
jgi:hypothetical protein